MQRVRPQHPLLVATCVALVVAAAPARAQQAPQPAPEIQRITALAGTFEGAATFTAGGQASHFTLRHTNTVVAGGFGLACREEADVPGMGRYLGENLLGWDAGRGRLHLLTVTNDPYTHDHSGPWTDAHHVTLRYSGVRDGKPLTELIVMEVPGPDEYRFHSTLTVAGSKPEVFEADMKRTRETASR